MPKRRLQGRVVSNKMEQTAVVRVERAITHPLYHKVMRRHKRYLAHDEDNQAQIGDVVIIEECRPLSKNKTWQLVSVTSRKGAP